MKIAEILETSQKTPNNAVNFWKFAHFAKRSYKQFEKYEITRKSDKVLFSLEF